MADFNFRKAEKKWQDRWEETGVFHAKQVGTAFKYRRIAVTMSFSAMVILHYWTAGRI